MENKIVYSGLRWRKGIKNKIKKEKQNKRINILYCPLGEEVKLQYTSRPRPNSGPQLSSLEGRKKTNIKTNSIGS